MKDVFFPFCEEQDIGSIHTWVALALERTSRHQNEVWARIELIETIQLGISVNPGRKHGSDGLEAIYLNSCIFREGLLCLEPRALEANGKTLLQE
jgi:hypothetical protein